MFLDLFGSRKLTNRLTEYKSGMLNCFYSFLLKQQFNFLKPNPEETFSRKSQTIIVIL